MSKNGTLDLEQFNYLNLTTAFINSGTAANKFNVTTLVYISLPLYCFIQIHVKKLLRHDQVSQRNQLIYVNHNEVSVLVLKDVCHQALFIHSLSIKTYQTGVYLFKLTLVEISTGTHQLSIL